MSRELIENLRVPRVAAGRETPGGVIDTLLDIMNQAADLIERQTEMLDRLDVSLCQFLNNVGDEYDPRVWIPSVKRDLNHLAQVYNDCHKAGIMDLSRSVITHARIHQNDGAEE